jgi:hypothetical protein
MGIDGSDIKKWKEERPASNVKHLEKKESPINQESEPIKENSQPSRHIHQQQIVQIDCHACKLIDGMKPTSIPRFGQFIRLIGFVLATPSALGMAIAVIGGVGIFFVGGGNESVGFIAAIVVFCFSLVGGLVGWLLLMKKKVFRCIQCGFIMDRS